MKPFEKQLDRLDNLGIAHYQEGIGYLMPKYWKLTHPTGKIEFACSVKSLKKLLINTR